MADKKKVFLVLLALILLFTGCKSGGGDESTAATNSSSSSSSSSGGSIVVSTIVVPTIALSASRISGVAPLSVFFNSDLVRSTVVARDFHDYEYVWNFDDNVAGIWANGKDKNVAKGAVAGHVFETPGTYTVILTVRKRDGAGSIQDIDTGILTITVTDPDVEYSGTDTVCICDENHNDFAGAPAGAQQVISTADNIAELIGEHTAAGRRVLLHRGSSWSNVPPLVFTSATPIYLGAYGIGTNEDEFGIYDNAPHLDTAVAVGSRFFSLNDKHDFRLIDIKITGTKTGGSFLFGTTNLLDILFYRMDISNFHTGFSLDMIRHSDEDTIKNFFIASSRIYDMDGICVFAGAENLAIFGNEIKNADIDHVTRIWWAYKSVYQHNFVSGSSLVSGDGLHALKFHGMIEENIGTFAETGASGVPFHSQFIIISDNTFGSSGPWPVVLAPQNPLRDERQYDVIFERNRVAAEYGIETPDQVIVGLFASIQFASIRNNIFDLTDGASKGIAILQRGVEPAPLCIHIFNNTIYRGHDAKPDDMIHRGVDIAVEAIDTVVRNNLVSFPFVTGEKRLVDDKSTTTTSSNNVLTDTPHFIDPENVDVLSRDFSLTAQSAEAIDLGDTVPVLDDFFGQTRTGDYDIGAYSY